MKAAIYQQAGGPEVMEYQEIPDPATPAADEILIRVEAISIEGGDLVSRSLSTPETDDYVLGYAAAGEIVAVGSNVTRFSVGQAVTTCSPNGSHAELRLVSADEAWAVPDGMTMPVAAAALCGPATAALAMQLAQVTPGQTALVLGATGGVGIAAVQLAHQAGLHVIGTGSNPECLKVLEDMGMDEGLLMSEGPVSQQLKARANNAGVNVLIDNVGGKAMQDALSCLNDGGAAVLIGTLDGMQETIPTMDILVRRLRILGCYLGPIMAEPAVSKMVDDVLDQVAKGSLQVPIDKIFPLSQVAKAHQRAEQRGRLGRVIIVPEHK